MNKDVRTLADELAAIDELRKRGYRERTCSYCSGTGYGHPTRFNHKCQSCDGKGYTWQAPLMR